MISLGPRKKFFSKMIRTVSYTNLLLCKSKHNPHNVNILKITILVDAHTISQRTHIYFAIPFVLS